MGSRIAGGGIKLFSARFAVSMISLLFYGVAAHVLDKSELAPLAAMAVIAEIYRVIRSFGLASSMLQMVPAHVARGEDAHAAWLIRRTILITVAVSIPSAAAAWLFRDAISLAILKQPANNLHMALIIGFAFFMSVYDALQLALLALQRFGRQGGAYIITMGSQRLMALVLLFIYGIDGCLFAFFIGAVAGNLLGLLWLRDYLFGAFKRAGDGCFLLIRYSLPYYAQEFARYIFHEADQFLVGLFLTPELLANFFIAKRIAHGLRMLIDSAADVLRPKMGELRTAGEEAVREGFARSSRFMSYLIMPIAFGIAAISGPLIILYAGADYAQAAPLVLVLSLGMLFYAYFSLYEVNLFMLGRPVHRLYADLFVAASTLAGFLALAGPFGDLGIALALAFGFIIGTVLSALLMRRILVLQIDKEALMRSFRASGGMFAVWSLLTMKPPEYWYYPVALIAGALLFVRLFAASMPGERVEEIRSALPRPLDGLADTLYLFGARRDSQNRDRFTEQPLS